MDASPAAKEQLSVQGLADLFEVRYTIQTSFRPTPAKAGGESESRTFR
jgi:hypothetical protein